MKECRRGNMLPHGVKRLMNKVTRFPNDRTAGLPSFLALVALICRNPIDIVSDTLCFENKFNFFFFLPFSPPPPPLTSVRIKL